MADLSLNTNWTRQLQYVFTLLLANPIGIRQDIAMILIIYSYQIMHFFALKKEVTIAPMNIDENEVKKFSEL